VVDGSGKKVVVDESISFLEVVIVQERK